MRTRSEHLEWCKQRALQYVADGDLQSAFASLASDLGAHPETEGALQICSSLGMSMMMNRLLDTPAAMKKFIQGFN